jgi:hypothetical protein
LVVIVGDAESCKPHPHLTSIPTPQDYIRNVSLSGGNSMRIWLFVEGQSIPSFASDGMVVGTDAAGSLAEDLRKYVRYAATQNVFINLCLWNGALMRDARMKAVRFALW